LDIHSAINNLTLSPTQEAQLKHLKAEAKKAKLPEAQYIRDQYISRKSAELVVASGLTDDEARHTIKSAMDSQVLYSDFRIELTSGDLVTVAEILSDAKKYHGQHCADPLEPDYHNDNRIGYIIINTHRSIIYSHAHGGTTYQLSMKRGSLIISAGKTADAVDDVVNLLRKNAGLYNVGSELAYFNGDKVSILARDSLAYVLGKLIQFAKLNSKREVVNIDPSDKLVTQFIALGEQRNLPKLNAVSDVPFLAIDGRVCDKDGYDPETKILLTLPEGGDFSVPSAPTLKMVEEALAFVWHPFKDFPFDSDVSRSVFLSFLLTTACRKSLPTAPALAIDAPDAGTGKSLLSAAIGLLMQGKIPANTPQVQSDDEMRKKLTSMLMQGDEVIVIDNIKGTFKSPVFEIFLTSEYYTDRVLGGSKMAMLPNKTLTIFNGNNLTLSSDLNRRVLTARIDAGIEAPYKRKFDLNPLDYIRTHRIDMIRALLLLIRGYLSSGTGPLRSTGMASFDDWERIVRQTVCWLGQVQSTLPLTDPNLSIDRNYEKDDEKQSISRIFEAWHAVFGDSFLLSKLLIKKINEPICPLIDDQETVDRLGEALLEVFDDGVDSQKLGRWLEKHVDRVVEGLKLIKSDKRLNGCVQWKVIRV
jgi:hypothetical protein